MFHITKQQHACLHCEFARRHVTNPRNLTFQSIQPRNASEQTELRLRNELIANLRLSRHRRNWLDSVDAKWPDYAFENAQARCAIVAATFYKSGKETFHLVLDGFAGAREPSYLLYDTSSLIFRLKSDGYGLRPTRREVLAPHKPKFVLALVFLAQQHPPFFDMLMTQHPDGKVFSPPTIAPQPPPPPPPPPNPAKATRLRNPDILLLDNVQTHQDISIALSQETRLPEPDEAGIVILGRPPPDVRCRCGLALSKQRQWDCNVFATSFFQPVQLEEWHCERDDCPPFLDLQHERLWLSTTHQSAFSYRLLQRILLRWERGNPETVAGFWQEQMDEYKISWRFDHLGAPIQHEHFPKNHFMRAVLDFIRAKPLPPALLQLVPSEIADEVLKRFQSCGLYPCVPCLQKGGKVASLSSRSRAAAP